MGIFFKDKLSDVGKYQNQYGNQKAYSVKSENDVSTTIHCEKTGPYRLSDDEFSRVLEQVKMNPDIINKYSLASRGGFPITSEGGNKIYVYFHKKTPMLGIGKTQIYAKPTHARK